MKSSSRQEDLLKKVETLERKLMEAKEGEETLLDDLGNTVLNALSAHVALLDGEGTIIGTNLEWREFGEASAVGNPPDTIGMNYLAVCDAAEGESSDEAEDVARGIRSVISGEAEEYTAEYPCHSEGQKRWFFMRAVRMDGPGPLRVIVSHENITALKVAEEKLEARESELAEKNRSLQEIVSPFLQRLTSSYFDLTPQEIQVAGLVKDGKMTKEIADFLNISASAVDFHRKNIRKKLGLKSRKANLRSYLLSLAE